MILDPDGEHALTDDGRMATRVFMTRLDPFGHPIGPDVMIGWTDMHSLFGHDDEG